MLTCIILDLHSFTMSQSFTNPLNTQFHLYMKYLITAACLQTFNNFIYTHPDRSIITYDEYIMFDVFYNYWLDHPTSASDSLLDIPISEAFLIQFTVHDLHTLSDMIIQTPQGYAFLDLFNIKHHPNPTLHDKQQYVTQIVHCYNLRQAQYYLDCTLDLHLYSRPSFQTPSNSPFQISKIQEIFHDCHITQQQFSISSYCHALIHTYKLNHHPLSTYSSKFSRHYTYKILHHNLPFHPISNAKQIYEFLTQL